MSDPSHVPKLPVSCAAHVHTWSNNYSALASARSVKHFAANFARPLTVSRALFLSCPVPLCFACVYGNHIHTTSINRFPIYLLSLSCLPRTYRAIPQKTRQRAEPRTRKRLYTNQAFPMCTLSKEAVTAHAPLTLERRWIPPTCRELPEWLSRERMRVCLFVIPKSIPTILLRLNAFF